MSRAKLAGGVIAIALVVLAATVARRALEGGDAPGAAGSPLLAASAAESSHPAFLHGRVITRGGDAYEGRLRWGGHQEAFWSDLFNGTKEENPWAALAPPDLLPKEQTTVSIFGKELSRSERTVDLGRPFQTWFGNLARVEAAGTTVRVTLKSGTVLDLDRHSTGDFDDGVRVWDGTHGVVDLTARKIRSIELFPATELGDAPRRLHGTVRAQHRGFTGFVKWDRDQCLGGDELHGRTTDGKLNLRFDTIRSIARSSPDSSLVTLIDGREILLAGGHARRGITVDDRRFGRVLISWSAFDRVDFDSSASSPAYEDFPPGRPLVGSVSARDGRRLDGRLVYDLDESETTDTLDAPAEGVNYTIPFGLIASITPRPSNGDHARVVLHDGEELALERAGDLGKSNAGLLIFSGAEEGPSYVQWADVEQVELTR